MKNIILLVTLLIIINTIKIQAQCHLDDWTALKALYENTNGDEWLDNVGWEQIKNDMPHENCDLGIMEGIILEGTPKRVTNLSLTFNNLVGNIPNEISLLSEIELLSMAANKLSDSIPNIIGSLNKLRSLSLEFNELSGNIPAEIANLCSLLSLDLFSNKLTGAIPPELGNMKNLIKLNLSENKLTGSIPKELVNIYLINLLGNQLTGSIPIEFGDRSFNNFTLLLANNNLNGCYDNNLMNLCDDFENSIYGFIDSVSPGNSFDASWEEFCKEGKGICDKVQSSPSTGIFKCE